MARLIGPDAGDRLAVRRGGGVAASAPVVVYANDSGSTLANILTEDGDAVAGSTLTTDEYGLIPLFQFPDGLVDTVYVEVQGGARSPVYARYDDRVDGLVERVETLEAGGTAQPLDADLTAIAALSSGTAGALVTDGSGWIRKTYAQLKTALSLGNVDNTSDANKPVSTATAAAISALSAAISALSGTYQPLPGDAPMPTPARVRGEVLHSMQTGHGWLDTGSTGGSVNLNDTTTFFSGTQAVSRTSNGAQGQNRVSSTAGTAKDFTASYARLKLAIDNVSRSDTTNVTIYASSDSFTNYYAWNLGSFLDLSPQFVDGRWQDLTLHFDDAVVTGSPNRAAITTWRVMWRDDGTGPLTLHLQSVERVPNQTVWPNGVWTFSMDDSWLGQYAATQRLAQYGVRPTLYTIVEALGYSGNYMTQAQLLRLQDQYAAEIGAHAYTLANHDAMFTTLSADALDIELRNLRRWLLDNGYNGVNHFAYPFGEFNAAVLAGVQKFFPGSARGTFKGYMESAPPGDRHIMRAKALNSSYTLALAKADMDKAKLSKAWFHTYGHKFGATADSLTWTLADVDALAAYAVSIGISIATVGEVMAAKYAGV